MLQVTYKCSKAIAPEWTPHGDSLEERMWEAHGPLRAHLRTVLAGVTQKPSCGSSLVTCVVTTIRGQRSDMFLAGNGGIMIETYPRVSRAKAWS